ncbi:MAG: Importin-5, partial [Marteilia pararefringens]
MIIEYYAIFSIHTLPHQTVLNQVEYKVLMQNILEFFESDTLNNEPIHDQHKIFSSTLLKNRLPGKDSDNEISQEMKLEFYEKYLNILQFISSIPVKNMTTVFKLFDILIENIYICLSSVPEKVQKLFFAKTIEKLGQIDNAIDPLIGIAILANTSGMWEEISISQPMLMPHVNKFFELFGQKMMQLSVGCDPNLNLAANNFIKYSSAFISRSQSTQGLESIVKILFEVSFHLIVNLKLEALSGGIIDFLQEISQVRPRLFKPYLDKILDLVIYIMETYSKTNNTSLENQKIKVSAMNFLCTLFVDMSNFMMKYQDKLRVFIVHVIDCMAIPDEEDDDFDAVEDDAENQNLDHISKQSEIVFDKMSVKNPQFMFQFVTQSVTNFLKPGSSVNQMYAGLNILCCAAEGCKTQYQESLEDIVRQFVLPYTYDSQYHSKVRYAALTALGQMLSDFGNILVSRLFDDVTEAYSKALLNSSSERVQCHAFAALNNFFESASPVYIPKAVLKLSPAFASFLQQNCSQRTIMAFFDTIIPLAEHEIDSDKLYAAIHGQLFDIITNACSNKDHLPVHSKAVLAICSLGQFANQDLFKADAQKLMHGLIKMMQSDNIDLLMQNIGYDDYLLSWDILIKKFADDFKEFLEFILSKIYSILQRVHKTGMEFFQGDSFKDMNAMNEAVRLQSLQSSDAIMCLRLLSTISEVYKRDVGTFMEKFVDLLINFLDDQTVMLLDHAYSALASMILTLSDAKIAQIWPKMMQITLDMNSDQVDSHSFLRIMSSFMSVVTSLGNTCLSPEFLDKFVNEIILEVLNTQHAESRKYAKLDYYRKNEDFEEYDMLDDGYLHEDEDEEQSYVEGIIVFVRTMFSIF